MTSGHIGLEESPSTSTSCSSTSMSSPSTSTSSSNIPGSSSKKSNADPGASVEAEHVRKFTFTGTSTNNISGRRSLTTAELEIKIPELLQSGYSFYTWPCAPILAWFLWERRHALVGKRILEIGAGTALPGIVAAKCGAHVVLSDNCIQPKSLAHLRSVCLANNLNPGQDINIIGLSWGLLLNSVFHLGPLDLIVAADCFYDPTVFEDIIVTVAFLLDRNPTAKFFFTYQERSTDWSIEALLKKWKLIALQVNIEDLGKYSTIDFNELMGGHTIHLIEITREV